MATHVALFRGINVGKAKRIAMAELKALFEELGYADVRTLLNSGNVVFDAGRGIPVSHAKRIAAAVQDRTGVSSNTLVLPASALDSIVAEHPFGAEADDPSRLLVGFYLDDDRAPFMALAQAHPEAAFVVGAEACHLWCPDGILESRVAELLGGAKFRDRVTMRNRATVLKLQALARG
ncbi:MAG: DUF1697 domain-containing protein [Lysobacteraceae bacterium]